MDFLKVKLLFWTGRCSGGWSRGKALCGRPSSLRASPLWDSGDTDLTRFHEHSKDEGDQEPTEIQQVLNKGDHRAQWATTACFYGHPQ